MCKVQKYVILDQDTLSIGISDVGKLIKTFGTVEIDHHHDTYDKKHVFSVHPYERKHILARQMVGVIFAPVRATESWITVHRTLYGGKKNSVGLVRVLIII